MLYLEELYNFERERGSSEMNALIYCLCDYYSFIIMPGDTVSHTHLVCFVFMYWLEKLLLVTGWIIINHATFPPIKPDDKFDLKALIFLIHSNGFTFSDLRLIKHSLNVIIFQTIPEDILPDFYFYFCVCVCLWGNWISVILDTVTRGKWPLRGAGTVPHWGFEHPHISKQLLLWCENE